MTDVAARRRPVPRLPGPLPPGPRRPGPLPPVPRRPGAGAHPAPGGLAPEGLAPGGLAPDGLAPGGLAPDGPPRARLVDISPVPPDHTRTIRRVVLAVFGLSVALFAWGFASGTFTSLERLREIVDSFGLFGPVLYIAAQAVQVVVPVIPGGVGIVAGPVLFGPVEGSVYNYVAVCLGSFVDFYVGRHVGLPAIRSVFGSAATQRYLAWTAHPHFDRWFAVAIVLPVAPDDLLCYLAGTTRMSARFFVAVILLGKPWAVIVYTFLVVTAMEHIVAFLGWG